MIDIASAVANCHVEPAKVSHYGPTTPRYSALPKIGALRRLLWRTRWQGDIAPIDWVSVAEPANDASADFDDTPAPEPDNELTPAGVIGRILAEGPRIIVPTGIDELDRLCGGGFSVPRRVIVVGMPSAWKTGLVVNIADKVERDGLCAGILAVDEEPEDIVIRLAQMAGFDRAKLQRHDPEELAAAREDLAGSERLFIYPFDWTIEKAAADLAARALHLGTEAVFLLDSLQTVKCEAMANPSGVLSKRQEVEANVRAFRNVTIKYRMLGIATSEANRAAYREGGSGQAALAAGAETRDIEYVAQTLIVLEADKDRPDEIFHAEVAKNRGQLKGRFSFKLNREAQLVTSHDSEADEQRKRDRKRIERDSRLAGDVIAVVAALVESPGLGKRGLYEALRARHGGFDDKRTDAALKALGAGIALRDGARNAKLHYVDGPRLPASVREAMPDAGAMLPPEAGA